MPLRSTADGPRGRQAAATVGPPGLQPAGPGPTDPELTDPELTGSQSNRPHSDQPHSNGRRTGVPGRTGPRRTALRRTALGGMRPGTLLRRHWLLAVLLAAGLVLRAAAQIAYRPALLYIDSVKYLYISGGSDPVGYRVLLKPLLLVGNLDLVAAVQHLLGLAMAVTLYLLMRRRGVPRWLAALATAPLLLDAYQIQIEQTIMPDTLFEALIVTGLALLLWQPRPRPWMIITAGLALGASAPVRQIGEILILPALIYLLITIPGWRTKLTHAAVLCAAFALPILAYCSGSYVINGHFRLAYTGTNEIYGRVVLAANCQALDLPAYEQALCPTHQQAVALGIDGLEHDAASPLRLYVAPPDMTFSSVISNFNHRLEAQNPVGIAAAIGKDAVKLFALQRVQDRGDTPIYRWQFQDHFPQFSPYITIRNGQLQLAQLNSGQVQILGRGQPFGGGDPVTVKPLASFLRAYQLDGGYAPGPLLLLAVAAGLLGSLGVLRRRPAAPQRGTAVACLTVLMAGAAVLLGSDVFQFSWRYQLPALITLPVAGALGLTVIAGSVAAWSRPRTPSAPQPGEAGSPRAASPGRGR